MPPAPSRRNGAARIISRGLWTTALGAGGAFVAVRALRAAVDRIADSAMGRLMQDSYGENLWEFVSATRRTGMQTVVETSLRAATGDIVHRPLGSPKPWPNLDGIRFTYAQLATSPVPHDEPVDMGVTLGPQAQRPLRVDTPILVSGMAYALALSAAAKFALARGATLAGSAYNSGEGPAFPGERQIARRLIVQFNRGSWGKERHRLREADMIEIQIGQGASGGVGGIIKPARKDKRLRTVLGVEPGREAVTYSRVPEWAPGTPLRDLVQRLRDVSEGAPVGVKLAAGNALERDLDVCLEAGVDVVAIDGGQAATRGSPPILQDDFGLPTFYALVRADRYLRRTGQRDRISLIVGGGLFTPGDYLKVLALGADAVYIGTMALFALAHTQTLRSLPWEPPTQIVFFEGKHAHRLDPHEAAHHLGNYLRSCTREMAVAVRSLGKTSVRDVGRDDLTALDPQTADVAGLPLAYRDPASPPRRGR